MKVSQSIRRWRGGMSCEAGEEKKGGRECQDGLHDRSGRKGSKSEGEH